MFGPTVGDRVRLADTDLVIEVEDDYTLRAGGYGEEVKFGGGKTIRDGMGASRSARRGARARSTRVITNALILDHWGIVKADIGIKGGRIAAHRQGRQPRRAARRRHRHRPGHRDHRRRRHDRHRRRHRHATSTSSARSRSRRRWRRGVTTMLGGGTGPATGTFATTCTPGPWNIERMLQAADAFPMNLGFLGKGNASLPERAATSRSRPARSA